ncbi:MAG TPA: TonB-dependent receptor, partial [Vicinamibacterales bacterium]|nr:TonB-dependent receptor [Vicinamibacterales bacterium]
MLKRVVRLSVCAVLMWCLPVSAYAQFETAAVVGIVSDGSGAVVAAAKVTLTNAATGVSATTMTDASGTYEFFTVRIGTYVVTAEKAGFSLAMADNVQVSIGSRRRVDLSLAIGALTETVTVSAGTDVLDTDTSQRGQTIRGGDLQKLPVINREYSALALLTTGVRPSALSSSREGSFNVNGLRSTFNNFLIDGVDNNAYGTSNQGFSNQVMQPAPDAVGEFQVVTNNMSAEYGRAAGATVNVAYRSGNNQFHLGAWEFFRDSSLTSEGYFKPTAGQEPTFDRNQFGGVIGGPLARNKAFFFGDFEGLRQNRTTVSTSTIPTMEQRNGVFTVAVRHPQTGQVYPAGTPVPMSAFAAKVLRDLPEPTSSGTANNYVALTTQKTVSNKAGGKIDVVINPNWTSFGRFGWRSAEILDQAGIPGPSGGDGNGTTYADNLQIAVGSTYVVDSSSLLEFRFGWSRTEAGKNPPALGSASALDAYGISGLPTDPRVAGGLPSQLITGYTTLGRQATNPQWQWPTVFNPKINYTRSWGRHSAKAGYEFQHIQTQVQDVNPLYGRDQYASQFSRPTGAAANNVFNLADFMFGMRGTFALSNILVADMRQNMHFLYAQDDIRVSDRLTVNLGLRYEYATPMWEKNNVLSNFDPAGLKMVMARDGSLKDRSTINPDRNNFGPRLGLAYT